MGFDTIEINVVVSVIGVGIAIDIRMVSVWILASYQFWYEV